ncbi:unnamed protein product [Linum tenue]|uniref:RBR-type E3 ubiquitin transferase n=1 Tax=Linum tenue TaxID=586396 RepID=A0AAV0QI78_9ROSI|nr:unnamed protein product [Linum tenue]
MIDVDDEPSDFVEEEDRKTNTAAFSTLSKEDIDRRQEDLIADVSTFLSVPRAVAIALLYKFKWDSDLAQENWFSDEEEMRRRYGLTAAPAPPPAAVNRNSHECKICFETFEIKNLASLSCGHYFCRTCWSRYIELSIDDGAGCLTLRCPEPNCPVLVCQSTVGTLISDRRYAEKYARLLRRSYIEGKSGHKWCPAPDCETAVKFEVGEKSNYDVVCDCTHEFCWNCSEDAHRPLDCATVLRWIRKNKSDSENVNWVLANTKACPKCRHPIEKNQGCNHMVCKCRHHFCWMCLGDWKKHGEGSGGYYKCNSYEAKKAEGKARKRAAADLEKLRAEHFPQLVYDYRLTYTELDCVVRAWMQIKECRRVLEWTYAYGYYLGAEEEEEEEEGGGGGGGRKKAKKDLFEFLQAEAETILEKESERKEFFEYRLKLQGLTNTTGNSFERLVSGLENGLED